MKIPLHSFDKKRCACVLGNVKLSSVPSPLPFVANPTEDLVVRSVTHAAICLMKAPKINRAHRDSENKNQLVHLVESRGWLHVKQRKQCR